MRFTQRRMLLGAMVIALAGFGAGWFGADARVDVKPLVVPAEPWREPSVPTADPTVVSARLRMRSPFGAEATPAPAAAESPREPAVSWRLSGIVADEHASAAVILITEQGQPGARAQYRYVGEELPDGSRIVEISVTGMTVEAAGHRQQVKLLSRN